VITKKLFTTIIAVVAVFSLSSAVTAALIDFELTPGGLVPTDNASLTTSYTEPGLTTAFGYDTGGDNVIDTNAQFESRIDNSSPNGYTNNTSGGFDGVAPAGNEWMLRQNKDTGTGIFFGDTFIVSYSVPAGWTLPTAASGEIWDIDDAESVTISAYSGSNVLLGTFGPVLGGFDESAYSFSFSGLADTIAQIRITGSTGGSAGIGYDNFLATGFAEIPVVDDDDDDGGGGGTGATPEPSTFGLAILGLLSLGAFAGRRHKRA
jgi:hypothetical protein